ncbi:MAG TPA: TRAP transporter TatT component family protein [Terriglobales bacterium]|nr:TRAP transporter TatT component family protein [Terriglobales bacterium]
MKRSLKAMIPVTAALALFALLGALPARSQAIGPLTQQGDDLYEQRGDLAKARAALDKYQDALLAKEGDYEVYWRMARVEYWIGDHAAAKDEKVKLFGLGVYHGKKAVALEPGKPDGHYWLGVNYGSYGEVKGVLKSLSLVGPIKAEMNKVLAINQAYEDGGADQLLGRLYYELPGIAGGSNKKSLEHLLKSKELGPRVGLTRIYLADTYLDMGEVQKAREELEYVIAMAPDPRLIPETTQEKEMARKKLAGKEFAKK